MKRALALAILFTGVLAITAMVAVPSVQAEPLATFDGEPVHVHAKTLEVDLKSGLAVLSGDVRIRRGDLDVTCERLEARYDRAPSVRWAKAIGQVRARLRGFEATAQEAELVLDRRELSLRGGVRLTHGGARMHAREVAVDLSTNKVTLHKVRGTLPVPSTLPSARSSARPGQ